MPHRYRGDIGDRRINGVDTRAIRPGSDMWGKYDVIESHERVNFRRSTILKRIERLKGVETRSGDVACTDRIGERNLIDEGTP